jgi:capsular polysaccharide transport system permease protein
MNRPGILAPVSDDIHGPSAAQRLFDWLWARRAFILVVVAPTLVLTIYYYLIAANQYQSEAHFVIRAADSSSAAPTSGFSQLLGLGSGMSTSQSEANSVSDYLVSHDAVQSLRANDDLVDRFRRPEADFISKLKVANPTPEALLKYYRGKVSVHTDQNTGSTVLSVRAFRAADAYDIIQKLLSLGEQRVNALNTRSYNDSVSMARQQLAQAEDGIAAIQTRMTAFRQARGDIDPQASGDAQIKLVSTLNADLVAARAQLSTMGALISHSSPQYVALARSVRSLEGEVAAQSSRTAGGSSTIATDLGSYEDLRLRQQFAAKRYEAAAAALEKAVDQAQRQQLYLVRIVQPNMPVKSLFPQRARIVITVFFGLLLAYSIGWLIAAGVREHAPAV